VRFVRRSFRGGCRGGCDLECASSEAGGLRTLLEEINNYATETTHRSEYWPQSAAQLSNRLARATPPLIAKGCIVERRRSGEFNRAITMVILIK
jgi:hypothetical protein